MSAIDVRVGNLSAGATQAERELARIATECGLDVRCHSWVGSRGSDGTSNADIVQGIAQARRAATVAEVLGASAFGVNAERDVWRGRNGAAHPGAVDFLDAFADTFFEVNRGSHLDYVGFADPREHYRAGDEDADGDLDTELPEHLRLRFHRVGVMAYQSTTAHIQRKLARAAERWPEHAEAHRLAPWLGVGRIDEAGVVVGSAEASRTVIAERKAGVFYVGFGAIGQLVEGHSRHLAVVDLVRSMRSREYAA